MKNSILISSFAILLAIFAFSCNSSDADEHSDSHNHNDMSMNVNDEQMNTNDDMDMEGHNHDNLVTTTFEVNGKCDMCKNRIETAALAIDGVMMADWSIDDKILSISYDENVNTDDILKAIADVGHDNERFTADDKVYNALPGCCLYR